MAAIMISVDGINCENLSCNKRGVHIRDEETVRSYIKHQEEEDKRIDQLDLF